MLKDILVCLEGSRSSETATRISIDIARLNGVGLCGLAIIDEPDIRAGTAVGIGGSSFKHERDEVLMADAKKHADDWIALFERRCREAGVPARSLEVVGRPVDSILDEMNSHDLTVIGKDANFRFETEVDDAQTRDAILHRANRPVLLVPELDQPVLGATVLVAYDGSRASKRAIDSFIGSGLGASRHIHVGTVDDNGAAAWDLANRAVEMFVAAGLSAISHNIVSVLSNTDALLELANKLNAGLMVMGAYAHSRLVGLFHGSATRGLVEKATIPLYLQH
jgi:nucleotide-binding universal stress UspA family protein